MSNRAKLISKIIYGLLIVLLSYITFMSFQGLLTMVSKEFKLILPFLGPIFLMIECVALAGLGYAYLFKEHSRIETFFKTNGFVHTIIGGIATIFMLINVITYKNWNYGGPTLLYPIDFLLVALLGLSVGILCIIKSSKTKDLMEGKEKKTVLGVFKSIGKYFYIFIALDRLGCFLSSICNGSASTFPFLILPYVLCLIPMASIICYIVKKSNVANIICSLALSLLACGSFLYIILNLFGKDATPFMKLISPFYGLDRISSLPITISFVTIVTIVPLLVSLVMNIVKASKK